MNWRARLDCTFDPEKRRALLEMWRANVNARLFYERGTFRCPHCGRGYPHQHVIDRKGKVHDVPSNEHQQPNDRS